MLRSTNLVNEVQYAGIYLNIDLQLPTIIESMHWTQVGKVATQQSSHMLNPFCKYIIFKCFPVVANEPAAIL